MNRLNMQREFNGNLIFMQDQLYYYALQLTENKEDAKDLVQETSYKALKNKGKLLNDKNVKAWLYTILRNTYINYLRSGYNKQLITDNMDLKQGVDITLSANEDSPEEELIIKELHDILDHLPVVYGKPLQMFVSGYSYKEISSEMKIPIGTVKSRIHLGKKKIRQVYLA